MHPIKPLVLIVLLSVLAGCATQAPLMPPPAHQAPSPPPASKAPSPSSKAPAPSAGSPNQGAQNKPGETPSSATAQPSAPKTPPKPPPRTAADASSPAVMSLLNSADSLAQAGQYEPAASVLERALDLQPRNPFIYQRLAKVRLAEGQNGQAEQLAMKSNSVSDNNPFVEAGNWQLIAKARKAAGNSAAASRANARAVSYQQSSAQYQQQ